MLILKLPLPFQLKMEMQSKAEMNSKKYFVKQPVACFITLFLRTYPLCFRNFQNVKLRLDFVEIWLFYRHSDFTWNQILANSKCYFWQFERFWILISLNLSNLQIPNLPKFKVQSLWNCQKWHFWTVWICQNLISRKIRVAVK